MTQCTCSKAGSTARKQDDPRCIQPQSTALITIDSVPYVGETPPVALQSWLTPNPLFYVRNHFDIPSVDTATWRLTVNGQVERPLELECEDVRRFPKQTISVTLECAGNNRSDLNPLVPGNPFQTGAVSTAVWGGVPLSELLKRAGIERGAKEVLFEGCDTGVTAPGKTSEPYLRSLPLDVAMHPDTLLAYEMNGEQLSQAHGYPLRLIVPGWYGMASVKWLRRISILDYSFEGFFQTDRYIVENENGKPEPLKNIAVKSRISWPQPGATLDMQPHVVTGYAWSGCGLISRVEVSSDGGETWELAELVGPRERYAWQQWNFAWEPPAPGHYTLKARAQDERGNVQPMQPKWNRLGYMVNGVQSVCVNAQ